jgi:hypothetical protein
MRILAAIAEDAFELICVGGFLVVIVSGFALAAGQF